MPSKFDLIASDRRKRNMNKVAAKNSLFDFCDLLQTSQIPAFLAFGTLLGAVRERDFIEYDTDIDVGTFAEYRPAIKLLCSADRFLESGFEVVRDFNEIMSFTRDGELIDLYFFTLRGSEYRCLNYRISAEQLQSGFSQIDFLGRRFNTVKTPEEDLRWRYGEDWRSPKRGAHALK